jgi:hypothetical protein
MIIQGDSSQLVMHFVGLHPMSYVFIYDATLEHLTAICDDDRGKERLKKE